MKRRITAFLSASVLMLALTGCSIFRSEFPDYDVTGYIQALLDSSYHGQSEDLIEITHQTPAKADENLQLTVENGAIYFCNAFEINPTEEQMVKVEDLVKRAYALSKFTVLEKKEISTGYTVDVQIEPLTIFSDLLPQAQTLRDNAKDLLAKQNSSSSKSDDEDNDDEQDSNGGTVVLTDVFIEEVITMCEQKINSPSYGAKKTVTMNILRTDAGELQLDTTQLEEIDQTVVLFKTQTAQ